MISRLYQPRYRDAGCRTMTGVNRQLISISLTLSLIDSIDQEKQKIQRAYQTVWNYNFKTVSCPQTFDLRYARKCHTFNFLLPSISASYTDALHCKIALPQL